MALTEQDRIKLYRHFEADMGEELATKMMDSLPPAGWGDVATKQDIDDLRVATKQDIDDLRVATKQDIEVFRKDTKQDIEVFRKDIEHLRSNLDFRFETMEQKFETMEERFGRQLYRGMCTQMLAFTAIVGAIATLTDIFRG